MQDNTGSHQIIYAFYYYGLQISHDDTCCLIGRCRYYVEGTALFLGEGPYHGPLIYSTQKIYLCVLHYSFHGPKINYVCGDVTNR